MLDLNRVARVAILLPLLLHLAMLLVLSLKQVLQLLVFLHKFHIAETIHVIALLLAILSLQNRRLLPIFHHLRQFQTGVVFSKQVILVGDNLDFYFLDVDITFQVPHFVLQSRNFSLNKR